jgi:FAD/FMN-containing dehydrogenase
VVSLLVASLARAVRGPVVTDPAVLAPLGRDGSHLAGRPPADPEDAVALVRWARGARVPLVPRGAGTSLDGESVPSDGAIVVDLSGWRTIHEVSTAARLARVDPGVVNRDLQEDLRPHGLFFPPNPGSWETATIGGNVGTNASGPRSYRYGSTRGWVQELEVVLGTGELVRLGTRAEKRSAGPDLLALLVGSEGTLGIVTEVTVRLAPLPPVRRGLVVPIPMTARLGEIAGELRARGGRALSALEYLDTTTAGVFPAAGASGIPSGPLLLLEVEAEDQRAADWAGQQLRATLARVGVASEPIIYPDADRLWSIRGEASRLLDRRFGSRMREDIAVPVTEVDGMLRDVGRLAIAEGVPLYTFAHLGEGSLHPNFVVDPASPRAERIRRALYALALGRHGTISGEHGIGRLKVEALPAELGAPAMRLLAAVKTACDPDGILNPGVLYPPAPGPPPSPSPSGAGAGGTGSASPSGGRVRRPLADRPAPARRRRAAGR